VLNNGDNSWGDGSYLTVTGGGVRFGHADAMNNGGVVFNVAGANVDNVSGSAMTMNGMTELSLTSNLTFIGTDDLDFGNTIVGFDRRAGEARTITVEANTLTLGGILTTGTAINGAARSDAGLIKEGAGTLALSGNNTYTGATEVNSGTLLINGSTTAASTVTVANGATLGGSGTIGGAITINAGGIIAPGSSIGQLTVDSLTLQNGATMAFELTNNSTAGTTYDQIIGNELIFDDGGSFTLILTGISDSVAMDDEFILFTGNVANLNTANITIINNTSWTGDWQLSEGSLILTAIPEPATYALLGGLLALGAVLIRRRMK
jgi:fibronectin-binding autotransporter adhesin